LIHDRFLESQKPLNFSLKTHIRLSVANFEAQKDSIVSELETTE